MPQFFILLLIILLAEVTMAILLFVYEQKVSDKEQLIVVFLTVEKKSCNRVRGKVEERKKDSNCKWGG